MGFAVVLLFAVGALNIACGFLIWRRRVYGLIAGYDARRPPPDPERLARWVGVGGIAIGIWCAAAAALLVIAPEHVKATMRIFAAGVVGGVIVLAVGYLNRLDRSGRIG